ncbi:hypothetical protein MTO96_033339 [Rhipicephalus appendiculatus]
MSASEHSTSSTTTHDASGPKNDSTPSLDKLLPAAICAFLQSDTVEEPSVDDDDVPGSGSVHSDTSFSSESTCSQDGECEPSKRRRGVERATSVETWIWEPGQLRATVDTSTPSKKPPNLSWIFFVLVAVCAFLMLTTYVRYLINSTIVISRNSTTRRAPRIPFDNASMESGEVH